MAIVTINSDFVAQKIKSATVAIFSPSVCHEVMEPDATIFAFWMLSFKPALSCSSLSFIKRFFSSSSFSAIRVVSSAYLRLLIFLPSMLIIACDSSSPTFCMMYSAYKLNKQGDNMYTWHILKCWKIDMWKKSEFLLMRNSLYSQLIPV